MGSLVHTLKSPFQPEPMDIRVLLPDDVEDDRQYPVVYVLPVEPHGGDEFGDGLWEVEQHDLHNGYEAIFVAPSFSQWPWYADHPTDPAVRQESHFLKVVVPFVEADHPAVTVPEGRLLLGFSKSGWGAWSMFLRHPDTFGRAAAWDAPLMLDQLDTEDAADVFGTQKNFERYRVPDLLRSNAGMLRGEERLVLTGYGDYREQHQQVHALLKELNVPHVYRDGPKRTHDWHSGWVPEAVELLFDASGGKP
jgi:hypothetical protein